MMNIKKCLLRAFLQNKIVLHKRERLQRLKEMATTTTSTVSDMPRPETPDPHRLEKTLAEIADLEQELQADLKTLSDLQADVSDVIAPLQDAKYIHLLTERYLRFKSPKDIAEELGISERWVYKQCKEARNALEKLNEKAV